MIKLFKEINLGVKRLLVSFNIFITIFVFYNMIDSYYEWKQEEQQTIEYLKQLDKEGQLSFLPDGYDWKEKLNGHVEVLLIAEKEGYLGYTPSNFEHFKNEYIGAIKSGIKFLGIFQTVYWGIIFFVLWVREGWLTKKEAV
ncbi:hypothetical protein [Pontibacter pudoricolor]|uniref:hypothetical protein n=1 Tax=Pontibacter pudoricolor TaxID=2694930 RepID=UPI0013911EC5|nr:hypothetical protein [Pontibacter pudoricolor]